MNNKPIERKLPDGDTDYDGEEYSDAEWEEIQAEEEYINFIQENK